MRQNNSSQQINLNSSSLKRSIKAVISCQIESFRVINPGQTPSLMMHNYALNNFQSGFSAKQVARGPSQRPLIVLPTLMYSKDRLGHPSASSTPSPPYHQCQLKRWKVHPMIDRRWSPTYSIVRSEDVYRYLYAAATSAETGNVFL